MLLLYAIYFFRGRDAGFLYAISAPRASTQQPGPEVLPIPCHSHNDYWRARPLVDALEVGCIGVEADIWPFEGDFYIGHKPGDMRRGFTLKSVYLDPIRRLLEAANCQNPRQCGLYQRDPSQTLLLVIDLKKDIQDAWRLLVEQLKPLREKGWLTTLQIIDERPEVIYGPLTIAVSGSAAHDSISKWKDRSVEGIFVATNGIFFDAPLLSLSDGQWDSNNSYSASASFKGAVGRDWYGRIGSEQRQLIKQHVFDAHSRGMKIRYWGLKGSLETRHETWRVLLNEGVDLINIDHLKEFRDFWYA